MRFTPAKLAQLFVVILLSTFAAGCARNSLVVVEQSNSMARGIVIGDITPVRLGTLETIRRADISPGVIGWGLGYGETPSQPGVLREAIFVDGVAISRASGEAGGDLGNGRLLGPFAAGIEPSSNPAMRYRFQPQAGSVSVADVANDAANKFENPVVAIGVLRFDQLETGAGLDGRSESQSFRNVDALFVGIITRSEDLLEEDTRRVFFIPPGEEGLVDELFVGVAAILKSTPRNWQHSEGELAANVLSVHSVDAARSRIASGSFNVYLIKSARSL
jgi:hypothetical protein